MRLRLPPIRGVAALAALAAAWLGWGAAAVRAQAEPFVFLSGSSREPADKPPAATIRNILLRPNVTEPFYVYVHNPTAQPRNLSVQVASGDAAGDVIARGTAQPGAGQTVRVALPPAAPAAPAAPASPAAPGGAAAPVTPAGVMLTGKALQLRLLDEKGAQVQKTTLPVVFLIPNQYVAEEAAFQAGPDQTNRLTVRVYDRKTDGRPFSGPSCKVQLEIRAPGLIPESTRAGTYEDDLPPGGSVTLTAENLRFREAARRGVVSVTVDGYKRAFQFDTDFSGTNPQPLTATALRIDNPRYTTPGKPCPVPLEVDNSPRADAVLEFGFDRARTGTYETTTLDGERRQRVTVRPGGPADALLFTTEVGDWVVDLKTAGVFGTRALRLRLLDPQGAELAVQRSQITLDETPPEGLRIGLPPRPHVRGLPLKVAAAGADPESGIGEALFFVGNPPAPDGKPAAGGQVVIARPPAAAGGPYTGELPMPNQAGKVQIGVRFTNRVGLSTDRVTDIELVDPPAAAAKANVGSIKGRVVQGSEERPQPGLTVELRDEKATTKVKTVSTNAKGEFAFTDLPPATYTLYSVKPADLAKALKPVTVEAGKEAVVTLSLKR